MRRNSDPQAEVFDAAVRWRGSLLEARRKPPFSKERKALKAQARAEYRRLWRLSGQYAKAGR